MWRGRFGEVINISYAGYGTMAPLFSPHPNTGMHKVYKNLEITTEFLALYG